MSVIAEVVIESGSMSESARYGGAQILGMVVSGS